MTKTAARRRGSPRRRPLAAIAVAALLCAGAGPSLGQEAPAGGVRGTVQDRDVHVSLARVRVAVVEARLAMETTPNGDFLFDRVPSGTYTLSFEKDGYEREVVTGVAVTAGRLTDIRAEMSPEIYDMEEIVATAGDLLPAEEAGLLEIREAAVSVQDAISAEVMSKAGVSDVAGALKLVVGASVVGGKYATVRGLSDRYTGVTIEGVRVPSADPRRRAVQVDLFPTGTIESVTVVKTFTPDLQGDFTGGGVDIKTKSIPEGLLFTVTTSTGYNSGATGNEAFLTYRGGGIDALGIDRGGRALPDDAASTIDPLPRFTANPSRDAQRTSRVYDRLVRSFSPTMGVRREAAGPNHGFSILAGNSFALGGDRKVGVLGALTYARKFDFYENAENNTVAATGPGQPLSIGRERRDSRGTDELLLGGLGSVAYRPGPNQELSLKLVLNQSAEDEGRLQIEETGPLSVEQNQSLHYTERTVGSLQLRGSHRLPGLTLGGNAPASVSLDWTAALNATRQDEPDVRFFRNTFDLATLSAAAPANSTDAQNTRRTFRTIAERNNQAMLNLAVPFVQWTGTEGTFKTGFSLERTDREYTQRSFTYHFSNQFGSFLLRPVAHNRALAGFQANGPDDLWTDVFLDPGRIGLASNEPAAPNQLLWVITPLGTDVDYTGEQTIDAFYGMFDLPLSPKVRIIGGARYERTELSMTPTNDAFGEVEVIEVLESGDRGIVRVAEEKAKASVQDGSLLPSLGFVYQIVPDMNLRGSWSRTLARPTFRELAPVATEEFLFGDEYMGNPALILSKVVNYDLRWEWFPSPSVVLAASGFYKTVDDPIEVVSFSAGGRSFVQPVNFAKGQVYGGEVEMRSSLGFLHESLKGLSAGMNVTRIASAVDVPPSEQASLAPFGLLERTRRLQGQPKSLLNLTLGYDNDRSGTSFGAFYSYVGETLVSGAARGVEDGNPDVFDKPFATLDAKVTQRISRLLSVSLRGENLLAADRRSVYRTPGGEETVKSSRGTSRTYTLSGTVQW